MSGRRYAWSRRHFATTHFAVRVRSCALRGHHLRETRSHNTMYIPIDRRGYARLVRRRSDSSRRHPLKSRSTLCCADFYAFIIQPLPKEVNDQYRCQAACKKLLLTESGYLICSSLQFCNGGIYLMNGDDDLVHTDFLVPECLLLPMCAHLRLP